MKMLPLLTSLSLLMFALGVRAQEYAPWYLRTPTAREYLQAIPDAIQSWKESLPPNFGKIPNQPIVSAIFYELKTRFPEATLFAQDYDLLANAYKVIVNASVGNSRLFENESDWALALFKAWMRVHPLTLPAIPHIPHDVFMASVVTTADFDNNGIESYIVDYSFGNVQNFLILEKDSALSEGYRIRIPLPWTSYGYYYVSDVEYSNARVEDINADGLPELLVTEDSFSYDFNDCYRLFVMTKQNNDFVNLIGDSDYFCDDDPVQLLNIDDDPALEIRYSIPDLNSWGCPAEIVNIFDWNGIQYSLTDHYIEKLDNLGCAMYSAEPLMWENQAEAAIPLYEHGLAVGWDSPERLDSLKAQAEMRQYAKTRLAIAYALAGQVEQSNILLSELQAQPPESEMMATMLDAMSAVHSSPIALCTAVYNLFWDYSQATWYYSLPSEITVGGETESCCPINVFQPKPEKAGCNAPLMIEQLLTSKPFSDVSSPIEQLNQRGIEIANSIRDDFDRDGREEWLVWPLAQVAPILFVPTNDGYQFSWSSLEPLSPKSHFEIRILPDSRLMLIELFQTERGVDCANVEDSIADPRLTQISFWHLKGGELEFMLAFRACKPDDVASLFSSDGREIHVWASKDELGENPLAEVTYLWDEAQRQYVLLQPVQSTSTPAPTFLSEADLFDHLRQVSDAFDQADFAQALNILDESLAHARADIAPLFLCGVHYWRALTLEALNRPDDALSEYISIVATDPESVWASLARLHLD